MKLIAVLALAAFATAQATQYDWSKITHRDLDVSHLLNMELAKNLEMGARIVGGVESIPHSRPYQVGLLLPVDGGTSFCGGSLISPKTVLTAAHCVDALVGPVEVILGAHNVSQLEPNQHRLLSSHIVLHAQWDSSNLVNDIALIVLPHAAPLSSLVGILPLAEVNPSDSFVGREALVSGWGRPADSVGSISQVLREVTVPVITHSSCSLMFLGVIQSTHICTSGQGGKSTCNGDSGGPLVVDGQQVGVVSFGIALGCERGWPAVFTRVTSYIDWIHANWH